MKRTITMDMMMKKLGNFISVENLPSKNGKGTAQNQFEMKFQHGRVFQSYDSFIGAVDNNGDYYFTDRHDYSNTTSSYCKKWCGMDANTRRNGLETGKFIHII